jgi:DNA-binding CsgD family transcriptional regulator
MSARRPDAGRRRESPAEPRPPDRQAALSPRQQQILQLLSGGMSNKEIARTLGLTAGTVKQHVHALFRKLGVTNRTMAVVRSAQPAEDAAASATAALPPALRFARRLVTAVVLEPRGAAAATPEDAEAQEVSLGQLRERFMQQAAAFDATAEPLPGGGLTAWFGRGSSHGDDAARSVAFVRSLLAGVPARDMPCAMGLGTVAEVLGDGEAASPAFRAFRVATVLASLAAPGAPLVCETTARMAGIREPGGGAAGVAGAPANARILRADAPADASVAAAWGGLPFLDELGASLRAGRCNWLAIESWPPDAGARLLAAIGECLASRRFPVYQIWMPAAGSPTAAERLGQQFRNAFGAAAGASTGESAGELLDQAAARGGAVVLFHGIDALSHLRGALKAATLERWRTLPLVIAGAVLPRSGTPQTVVRLLGPNPAAAPFSRVLRMAVPEDAVAGLDGILPHVQAVLDRVSPFARAVARAASLSGTGDAASIASALAATPEAVQAGCEELRGAGLAWLEAGALRFRDDQTAGAVRATLVSQPR